jgi:hypothetical protein
MTCGSAGSRAEITWTDVGTKTTGAIDALNLAEGCVAAWQTFISSHNPA